MIRRAFALALLVACSSSSYAEQDGTESGPCYPNGTCNTGLTCASNRCVRVDGGGVTDGGSSDGSTNTPNDGAPNDASDKDVFGGFDASACYPPMDAPPLVCGSGTCASGDKCCAGDDICKGIAVNCPNAGKPIACRSAAQCSGGEVCCAQADIAFDRSSCPVLVNNVSSTTCKASCGTGDVRLCFGTAASACGQGGTCIAGVLEGSPGGNDSVGVCFGSD